MRKTIKKFTKFLCILINSLLPIKTKKYHFAFIVHPRNLKDVYAEFPFFKLLPDKLINFLVDKLPPLIVSEITGLHSQKTNKEIRGCMISINMFPKEMLNNREKSIRKIIKSIKLAQRNGVKIVGLGALTSSVSGGGLLIKDEVKNIYITTGHAYTIYNITQIFLNLVSKLGIDISKIKVAIVGAAGSIGSGCAQSLAKEGIKHLILIDLQRKLENIENLLLPSLREINHRIKTIISSDLQLLKEAVFIITATNASEAIVKSEHLIAGTVILDDTQPSDIDPSVFDRDDIIVIEAGLAHTPGIKTHFNFGFRDKYDNYSCLAEIIILSAIEYQGHFVIHRADLKSIDMISKWAKKLDFRPAELQNFKEIITKEKFDRIKKIITERLNYNND